LRRLLPAFHRGDPAVLASDRAGTATGRLATAGGLLMAAGRRRRRAARAARGGDGEATPGTKVVAGEMASTRSPREAPEAAPAGSAPAWREKYWFPIASVLELDPQRPTPVRIDGLDLVVWRVPSPELQSQDSDSDGWRIFADMCPHRLAPLSEGRIEPKTGCLQCAYHGWEFNDKGGCACIPQVTEEDGMRMRANPRSGAIAFPVRVAMNVLWAWLGEGPPQGSPSDLVSSTHLEEQEVYSSYTRDLPYTYDGLIENLLDVSHIPFAHHGLQGTRDDAAPISMPMPQVGEAVDEDGNLITFSFEDRTMGMNRQSSFFLRSPFFFFYKGKFIAPDGDGGTEEYKKFAARRGIDPDGDEEVPFRLNVICVPVAPGRSRVILLNTRKRGKEPSGLMETLPQWVAHLFANRFLDSDLAFLHYQERNLRFNPRSAEKWQQGYFMPAPSDRSIGAWRQWLDREGARCVLPGPGSELPPSPLRREELLDRFGQHTTHCVHCRQALENIEVWTRGIGAAGLGALALDRLQIGPTPLWLSAEILAVVAIAGMQRIKQEFHFSDYEHYKS